MPVYSKGALRHQDSRRVHWGTDGTIVGWFNGLRAQHESTQGEQKHSSARS